MKKKKVLFILLVIVVNSLICGCDFIVPVESMNSTYKNFEQYKGDFETIVGVVKKHGEGTYYINKTDMMLLYLVESPADDGYNEYFVDVALSNAEKKSLLNIVDNSYRQLMERIVVDKDSVSFLEESRYLGVIYTQGDVESAINKLVGHQSDRLNFLHNELSEDWYTIYY